MNSQLGFYPPSCRAIAPGRILPVKPPSVLSPKVLCGDSGLGTISPQVLCGESELGTISPQVLVVI